MHPTLPSGRCVCLYQDEHRSLVANIGAAAHFTVDFLTSSPENQKFLNDASMIFAEGFFLQNRFPVCQYIVEDVQKRRGKILAYNLGATYVIETLTDESKFMAESADVVFGNAAEYARLGQICYSVDTAEECAVILHTKWRNSINVANDSADLNYKENTTDSECIILRQRNKIGKILVVTDGDRRILVVDGRGATRKQWVDVPKLSSENIVDTTGAGDFFAAGFCWGIMKGYSSRTSAKFGCCLSAMNIANIGVIIPLQPPPNIEDFVDQEDEKDFPLESSLI